MVKFKIFVTSQVSYWKVVLISLDQYSLSSLLNTGENILSVWISQALACWQLSLYPGGGTLGISGWGCAAGTLEPLAYTRASSAEFCYPILE